jgi:hypothetical protein
MIVM